MLLQILYTDTSTRWQLGLQDPASPIMESIINFHNHIMFFLTFIAGFTIFLILFSYTQFSINKNPKPLLFNHHTVIEIIWTLIPASILILIAVPSFALLYSLEEVVDPLITIKIIGHQWYWTYEFSSSAPLFSVDKIGETEVLLNKKNYFSFDTIEFDSYMINTEDLKLGQLRLLEVDNRLVLPTKTPIRLLVTSEDVLHSFAVPSLGIKIDACPGRLNQVAMYIKREGVFYGQCSEICGINHAFMPIVIESTDSEYGFFTYWFKKKLN